MKTNTSLSTVTCPRMAFTAVTDWGNKQILALASIGKIMTGRRTLVLLALLAVAGSLVAPMPCQARSMKNVKATITSTPTATGTVGTIDGNYGLEGTTIFTTTGVFPGPTPTTVIITGILAITAEQGTLTTTDSIILDVVTGEFTSVETVTGGTGRYAGATGTLYITGVTLAGPTYVSNITGTISRP